MKHIVLSTAAAATVLFAATTSFADGHGGLEVVVPRNLCPETKSFVASWAAGKQPFTAIAVPSAKEARECGEPGDPVVAGIAQSENISQARLAALDVCNQHRGEHGKCVVIGTVRPKS